MDKSKLEALIEVRGKDFFAIISGEKSTFHIRQRLVDRKTHDYIKVIYESFILILCQSKEIGAFIRIDMEQYEYKK